MSPPSGATPTSGAPSRGPRQHLVFRPGARDVGPALIGVLAAGLATLIAAVVLSGALAPVSQIGVGGSADLGGWRFTLLEITRADALADAEGHPVAAPPGSSAVVVRYRVEVVDEAARADVYCNVELTDGQRRWPPDLQWLGLAEIGAARSCGGSADAALAPGRPVEAAVLFVVPADTGNLVAELSIDDVGELRFAE